MVDLHNLGARIRKRREEVPLTQEELGNCVGVSYQAVQAWEAGTVPRTKKWQRLADCLKTTVEELFYNKPPPNGRPRSDEGVLRVSTDKFPIADLRDRVPVIPWAWAGNWKEIKPSFHPGDAEKWIFVTVRVGDMAFAVRVTGDAMEPRVPAGSLVVIDPDRQAENGSIVLARRAGAVVLKQYWQDNEARYLRPLNDKYPILDFDGAEIIGVAVQVVLDL